MRLSLDEGSARAQGQHGSGDAFDHALRLKQVNLMAGPGRLDVQAVAAQEIETRIGSVP